VRDHRPQPAGQVGEQLTALVPGQRGPVDPQPGQLGGEQFARLGEGAGQCGDFVHFRR
jgi:hypothetical protein